MTIALKPARQHSYRLSAYDPMRWQNGKARLSALNHRPSLS